MGILQRISQRISGSEILSAGLGSLGVSMLGLLANLALINVINRFYGTYELGVFAVFLHLLNLAGIFSMMGLSQLTLRDLAGHYRNGDSAYCHRLLKSTILYIGIVSVAVAGILAALNTEEFTRLLFKKTDLPPYLFKAILCIPGFTLGRLLSESLRAVGRIVAFTLLNNVLIHILVLLAALLLLRFDRIHYVLDAYLAVTYGLLLVKAVMLMRYFSVREVLAAELLPPVKLLGQARAFYLNSFLFQLQPSIGVLILTRESQLEDVAYFDVILKIANLATMALTAFNAYTAPKFAELFPRKDLKGIQQVIWQANFPMYSLTLPVFTGIMLFPAFFLSLFDVHAGVAAWGLIIVGLAQTINTIASSVGWFLNMTGKQETYLGFLSISIALNFGIGFALVHPLGLIGVCIGAAVGIVFLNLWSHFYIRRTFGINTILGPLRFIQMVRKEFGAI